MIPLRYRLRPAVRMEAAADGDWLVVSGVPLSVLRVNVAAARLLESLRGGATVDTLAAGLSLTPERCLELCETFRRRGLLEVEPQEDANARLPTVTVVVPTRDRADALGECLRAVSRLDYPRELLDVIVVDDGSDDATAVEQVAVTRGASVLAQATNLGPAAARNRAAAQATGEVLAFVDSDCVADPGWLRALTPYFAWSRVGAVAGRTRGYFTDSLLARYEEVSSPLDMGTRLLVEAEGPGSFYAPTCNLLVRRSVYRGLGGLREELRLGEDVDFCWRLRGAGHVLVFEPSGVVRHKHLDRLPAMLRRRADYGSSEPLLHALHPDRRGRLRLPAAPAATVALAAAGLITRRPPLLAAALVPPLWDAARRARRLRRSGAAVPLAQVAFSTLRAHLSALYFACFRLVRYHLWATLALGAVAPGVRTLGVAAVLYAAAVDYATRRPRLGFPEYLGLYVAEHAAYQTGVQAGRLAVARRRLGAAWPRRPAPPPTRRRRAHALVAPPSAAARSEPAMRT